MAKKSTKVVEETVEDIEAAEVEPEIVEEVIEDTPEPEPEIAVIAEEPIVYRTDPRVINKLLENGYGSGSSRLVRMKAAGLDPNYVHKALAQLIAEVRDGKWGNENLRYRNLRAAGYDAVLVRREVMKKR